MGNVKLARQWMSCLYCATGRDFVQSFRDHGTTTNGHRDRHCTSCEGCRYAVAEAVVLRPPRYSSLARVMR